MMRWVTHTVGGLAAVILLVPVVILGFQTGPHALLATWNEQTSRHAMAVTLQSGLVALAIVGLLGIPTGVALNGVRHRAWRWLWGTALLIPLLMPPLVLGLVLAFVLGPATPMGQWFHTANTFTGLVLAQVYESLPYFVMAYWGYLQALPVARQEEAAVLGKSPWQIFWYVVWPTSRPGLAMAAAMSWARIVGAFGAPIVVAYHPSGLPVAIWIRLEEAGLPAALALAAWLLLIALPIPVLLGGGVLDAQRYRE
ncbi:MAG: ABC transporter permease subunit [Thermaerobacter sp.]|nr:ABC transporter permease subunit [Thermaerobacter sp.]